MLADLCPPALIYLIFSTTQIVIDTIKGFYNTAFLKIWVTFAFTVLLNFLCKKGLGIVSWIIVFVPFILMTLIISILLIMFGLDPATGRTKVYKGGKGGKHERRRKHEKRRKHERRRKHHDIPGRHGGGIGPSWTWDDEKRKRKYEHEHYKEDGYQRHHRGKGDKWDPKKRSHHDGKHPYRPNREDDRQGYIVKPIVLSPDGIQGAYDDDGDYPGFLGPDGNPRGYEHESDPKTKAERKKYEKMRYQDEYRRIKEEERRHNDERDTWPSSMIGAHPEKVQRLVDKQSGEESHQCKTFCSEGKHCSPSCKSWGCANCIPAAPADLLKKCKTASASCSDACTQEAANACLLKKGTKKAYLNPRKECSGWAPCMILHKVKAGGYPAGRGRHGYRDKEWKEWEEWKEYGHHKYERGDGNTIIKKQINYFDGEKEKHHSGGKKKSEK